jgi:ParB-like chromosome segregation protein Spo0J
VQTEDKGRGNPLVESLVYTSGEILYSRRTAYDDLVEQDVDREAIASLMERQHRSIVNAVQTGGLARLTGEIQQVAADDDTTITHREAAAGAGDEPSLDQVILDYLESQRDQAHLTLRASIEHDFAYGSPAPISVLAVDSVAQSPQAGVKVVVLFKSTAEPRRLVLAEGETGEDGIFSAEADMPAFADGTSAVVITAESDLGSSEMKHLVHK